MSFRVGIDTGGTFTDGISVDSQGNLVTAKSSTTPKDLAQGTMNAIKSLARNNKMELNDFLAQVTTIVHGTTQGTNVIITRKGPKLGLIGTEGHGDVIQLRRVIMDNAWDWRRPFPEPLVPRYLRVEVSERVDSRGNIVRFLDEESVRKAVAYLKKMKVTSIVVALLWSFLHPEHEKRIGEIVKKDYPGCSVTLSHEILPTLGEYERTSTAVISAYTAPSTANYIHALTEFLEQSGFRGTFLFMQNNGGVETAEIGIEKPATLATSGPAAGPAAAMTIGELHKEKNLVSVDMGGTSFDCALIRDGRFSTKTESLIANHRFSLPVIDVESIGAGGGSIAWFDGSGTLRVGPQSAGAEPGPVCYGGSGTEPTVTDANLILGYISPDYFLGGEMKLQKEPAERTIKKKVADRLGLGTAEAAYAIYKVSNSVMADGIAQTFNKSGYDPRDFALVAGGAATPACALKIAEDLSLRRVFIPKYAPIYCAFGMLDVDLIHDFTRFYHADMASLDLEEVRRLYGEMEAEGLRVLEREEVPEERRILQRTMQVRYWGQFRDVEVSWPGGPITMETVKKGLLNFHARHKDLYGSSDESYPVQFMGFGLRAIGEMHKLALAKLDSGSKDASQALKSVRQAYFEEANGFVETRIYDGDRLLAGNVLDGPCIVEERMTTVVIPPGFQMTVDEYGNYVQTNEITTR